MENVATILSYASFLLSIILAISEIRKRRSEARNIDTSSDTKMMTEIKQASLDLFKELKQENLGLKQENQELKDLHEKDESRIHQLEEDNANLRKVVLDFQIRLDKCERTLRLESNGVNNG